MAIRVTLRGLPRADGRPAGCAPIANPATTTAASSRPGGLARQPRRWGPDPIAGDGAPYRGALAGGQLIHSHSRAPLPVSE
jgi:hypothetical protein